MQFRVRAGTQGPVISIVTKEAATKELFIDYFSHYQRVPR